MAEVEVSAKGKLERYEKFLALRAPGSPGLFVLEGGKKIEELKRLPNILNRQAKIVGLLHPEHGDRPPGLTVESFELIGDNR